MTDEVRKFPRTPHLLWLSKQPAREDKVMARSEAHEFLASGEVVVEEKVDGANLGLSFDDTGRLRAQNRGNYLEGRLVGQWDAVRGWMARHRAALKENLPLGAILFGEWCYAQHSMRYTCLPDWFIGFDVLDASGRFWSTHRRNLLLSAAGLAAIRCVARGKQSTDCLQTLLKIPSAYSEGPLEGLYLRREDDDWLLQRAKLVRPEFIESIDEHWSHGPLRLNRVQGAAA